MSAAAATTATAATTTNTPAHGDFIAVHRVRLREALKKCGVPSDDGWAVSAKERRSGASKGIFDVIYYAPDGTRLRSIKAVLSFVLGVDAQPQGNSPSRNADAAARKADADGSKAKRRRTNVDYAAIEGDLDDDAALALAVALAADDSPQRPANRPPTNGVASSSSKREDNINGVCKRKDKLDRHLAFDRARNKWVKTLRKVQRHICILNQKIHFLSTFAADAARPGGNRQVKQTQESQLCQTQIAKSKEAIRECLKECEEADGHAHISDDHFDENGEVDFEHIQCSACSNPTADDENDILMCDGEFCNRAYHVKCLPVKDSFCVDDLKEDDGWLCPACDCRYDILWELAEMFDLDYLELTKLRWQEVLKEDDLLDCIDDNAGPTTILNAALASDDESDDDDFNEDSSDEGETRAAAAEGLAGSSQNQATAAQAGDEAGPSSRPSNGKMHPGEAGNGAHDAGVSDRDDSSAESDDDEDDDDESGDDDNDDEYEDDTDEEGGNVEAMLELLNKEAQLDTASLVLNGKRQRSKVDYQRLNLELFGDVECYDGEGVDDDFKLKSLS